MFFSLVLKREKTEKFENVRSEDREETVVWHTVGQVVYQRISDQVEGKVIFYVPLDTAKLRVVILFISGDTVFVGEASSGD